MNDASMFAAKSTYVAGTRAALVPDMAALHTLLPLRKLVVTLRFTDRSAPDFFHHAALYAFVRSFSQQADDSFESHIRIDACESGRISYAKGDYYRFTVIAFADGLATLRAIIEGLQSWRPKTGRRKKSLVFGTNVRLAQLDCGFGEHAITDVSELAEMDEDTLADEVALWEACSELIIRFVSPLRILRESTLRKGAKGEARYCRDAGDVTASLLVDRLQDSINALLRQRGANTERAQLPPFKLTDRHFFWIQAPYGGKTRKVMGGLCGQATLRLCEAPASAWWSLLVLGQYIGFGQRAAFGFGRYVLHTSDGDFSYRRPLPAASLLDRVANAENLAAAWRHLDGGGDVALSDEQDEAGWYPPGETPVLAAAPVDDLVSKLALIAEGCYRVPNLVGHLIDKRGGGVRALSVPPFFDRVLQRAVAQILTPPLDRIMYARSYGYRRGRSRITARYDIQAAWREGYRYVYESDIEDFFNSVDHERLHQRLTVLYDADPLVNAIMDWMSAPVDFEGQTIVRDSGLPMGSPLSPLMANLILDDFDSDMDSAGFRLVRFADDFVVLCKSRQEAEAAAERAQSSLAEHGLNLNARKTAIRALEDGVRFLGYLFVNDYALDLSAQPASPDETRRTTSGGRRPRGWLAKLGMRTPLSLDKTQTLDEQIRARLTPTDKAPDADVTGILLCVTGKPTVITTRGGHLRILRDDHVVTDLPWTQINTVVVFGKHQLSTQSMTAAMSAGVCVHFATSSGSYRGALWSGVAPQTAPDFWLDQARSFADPTRALHLAGELVNARLRHMREVLRARGQRDALTQLSRQTSLVARASDLDVLRGIEGSAARAYYSALAQCLPNEFGFIGRNRRPPRDPFNVLLSLGYSVLYGWCDCINRAVGFYPWTGFYHQGRGNHAALASDLMEPFRHIVERTALTCVRRRIVTAKDFSTPSDGGCLIDNRARRKYLSQLTRELQKTSRALKDEEAKRLYGHIHSQALSLKAHVRNGTPFVVWRTR